MEPTGLIEQAGRVGMLTPADVVSAATEQAKLLMQIVEQTKCYQDISGKRYLQVEAWETIGAFNRVHAITKSITPIGEGEAVKGYLADVELIDINGMVVGGASMPCFFTENACRGKEGDAKHKACMSAAQTFATSKAYRMNYSYVAILAGYQPTPAEEISGSDPIGTVPSQKHMCPIHDVPFFKKGKMKGYAHKYTDENGDEQWCNEPEQGKESAQATPEPTAETPPVPPESTGGKPGRNPDTILTWNELQKACHADFNLQPKAVKDELNVTSWDELSDSPADCYRQIAAVRE